MTWKYIRNAIAGYKYKIRRCIDKRNNVRWNSNKSKAISKIIIIRALHLLSPFIFCFHRRILSQIFFYVLSGRADVSIANRVMYKQFLREIPSLFARHTNAIARSAKFPMGTPSAFSICSYQISLSLAITLFPAKFRPASARARNFRFSSARSLAIISVQFSLGRHLSLIPPPRVSLAFIAKGGGEGEDDGGSNSSRMIG